MYSNYNNSPRSSNMKIKTRLTKHDFSSIFQASSGLDLMSQNRKSYYVGYGTTATTLANQNFTMGPKMFQARSRSVFGSSTKKQDSGGFTQWPMHDHNKIQNKIKLLNSPNRRLDSRDSVLC